MQYLKKEVRERILKAAINEFKEYGFSSASIRNIATNAEISLGNVYRYFENKEALYLAIINPFMESIKQVTESGFFDFQHKTMKQLCEELIKFLTQFSEELIIIRKGNTVYHQSFVQYISEVLSKKITEMMKNAYPNIDSKIQNPNFYNAIAESFLTALFNILRNDDDLETQQANLRELITFFFGNMRDRFHHYE